MKIIDLKGGEKCTPKNRILRHNWGIRIYLEREDTNRRKDDGVVIVVDKGKHKHYIYANHLQRIQENG